MLIYWNAASLITVIVPKNIMHGFNAKQNGYFQIDCSDKNKNTLDF